MAEVIDNKSNASICRVFRFKFNKEIIDMLTYFAKLHQYDKRADYKEAWKVWYEENNDTLQREANRIIGLGYSGNVEDKMYKAARYYFRKVGGSVAVATLNDETLESDSVDKGVPSVIPSKRVYIPLNQDIIDAMDTHIKRNIDNDDYTPASGFDDFCKKNILILAVEIKSLEERVKTEKKDNLGKVTLKNYISSKIKKTYKNRYYQLRGRPP